MMLRTLGLSALSLVLFLSPQGLAQAGYVDAVVASNPSIWLRMQEMNVVHATPAANSGSTGGAAGAVYLTTGGTGGSFSDVNSAFPFSGSVDPGKQFNPNDGSNGAFIFLDHGNPAELQVSEMTMEFLFRADHYNAGLRALWATSDWDVGSAHLNLNGTNLELALYPGGVGDVAALANMQSRAPVGEWKHIAITVSDDGLGGLSVDFYINGAWEGDSNLNGNTMYLGKHTSIASWLGTGRFFDGGLDEFAVYTRALDVSEIQGHYNALMIPEPASFGLFASALIGLAVARRRRLA